MSDASRFDPSKADTPDDRQLLVSTLQLVRTPGLGARKIKLLCDHFGNATRVQEADAPALEDVEGMGVTLIAALLKTRQDDSVLHWIDALCARADAQGVRMLASSHEDYPTCLQQIFDPPPVLYVRGTLPATVQGGLEHNRALAIVGTRDASDYGRDICRSIAESLTEAGVSILSGLALGIDGEAHSGAVRALRSSKRVAGTVAVLGCGVDVVYPRQHERLSGDILATGGAIVSEYALGTRPDRKHFPGRNRIINGLSAGTLVVEADIKSGALITAEYAAQEGRTVFAIPGRIGDKRSAGTLELIKQGAHLVTSAQDILDAFHWHAHQEHASQASLFVAPELPASEQHLLTIIQDKGEPLLDDLMAATGMPAQELLVTLTLLELKGIVRSLATGRYAVVRH